MDHRRRGAVTLGLLGPAASAGIEYGPAPQAESTVGPGSPAQFRLKEEHDRTVARLTDELGYLQSVFASATPGSPAQFRAHEEAESLRERLGSLGRD